MAFRQVCFTLALSLSDESRDGVASYSVSLPYWLCVVSVVCQRRKVPNVPNAKTSERRSLIRLASEWTKKSVSFRWAWSLP